MLKYLRANGYKTYIATGGGQDFVRVYPEATYGIPPEQHRADLARMRPPPESGRPSHSRGAPPSGPRHSTVGAVLFLASSTL